MEPLLCLGGNIHLRISLALFVLGGMEGADGLPSRIARFLTLSITDVEAPPASLATQCPLGPAH